MNYDFILASLLQGLILSFVAYAIMLPFRVLNLPDLTADGAYPFAGAICTTLLLAKVNPALAILGSIVGTGLIGIITGLLYARLQINSLLASIIVSTMLYGVNLKILNTPNVALFAAPSVFSQGNTLINILLIIMLMLLVITPLLLLLHTEIGLKLRVVGLNHTFAKAKRISLSKYTIGGLIIANCYIGIAGSVMVQLQNYMDIGMGFGIGIHALAALMIGECIIGKDSLNKQLLAPLIGALIYQQIQGVILMFGFASGDLKLITGLLLIAIIKLQDKNKTLNSEPT